MPDVDAARLLQAKIVELLPNHDALEAEVAAAHKASLAENFISTLASEKDRKIYEALQLDLSFASFRAFADKPDQEYPRIKSLLSELGTDWETAKARFSE